MCDGAKVLADLPPWDAVETWLKDFVDFGLAKSAMASELVQALGKDSEFFARCKTSLMTSATLILARGAEAGVVRRDVQPLDVLKLVGGIAHTHVDDPEQAYRMLDVVLDGLRPRQR
jgi:hypothetical protein